MTDPTPPYISARKPIHHTVPFNGASIYTTFWPVPEGQQIKGRLIYIHGFSEYHALDVMFFDRISNQGYEVFTYDQRGAGLTSTGADKGISNEFHVFNDLDFIIERNIEELKGTNRKLHLFGFSMGGGIVLNYGVKGRYKDSFETIIAIGSVISVDKKLQSHPIVFQLYMLLTYITPNTRINTGLRGGGMTSHKGWSEYINKDKYVQPSLTSLRQIHDFIKRGQKLLDPTYVKDFNKSVLIIHGSSDRVNEPKGSIDFFNLINVSDKELHIIEGSRHKVLAEKEEIYLRAEKIILSWLNKRSKAKL